MASGDGPPTTARGTSDEVFNFECSICMKEGKRRIQAKSHCKHCGEYLCNSCVKAHGHFPALRTHTLVLIEDLHNICGLRKDDEKQGTNSYCKDYESMSGYHCRDPSDKFRDSQNDIIVSRNADFQYDTTVPCDISVQLGQLSTKPSDIDADANADVCSENKPLHLLTQDSGVDSSSRQFTKPSSTEPQTVQREISNVRVFSNIKNVKVMSVNRTDPDRVCDIKGCCFMPGGELVVCDYGEIRLLDRSFSAVDNRELCGSPHDVAVVDNNNVVVAMPWQKQLHFIQVLPTLKKGHTIDIGIESWSVAAAAGKIFVPKLGYGTGEIGLYDSQGRELEPLQDIRPDFGSRFQDDYPSRHMKSE